MITKIVYGPANKIASYNFQPGDILISFANSDFEHVEVCTKVPRHFVSCTSAQYKEEGAVFTPEMGKALVEFIKNHSVDNMSTVLVNCDHGEIRSASCAKALKDFFEVSCFFVGKDEDMDPDVYCHRIYDNVLDALM